jgi:hypothetical protein
VNLEEDIFIQKANIMDQSNERPEKYSERFDKGLSPEESMKTWGKGTVDETLDEIAEKLVKETFSKSFEKYPKGGKLSNETITEVLVTFFKLGVKHQQERSYSEEEVYNIIQQLRLQLKTGVLKWQDDFEFDLDEWFDQFKKK